MFPERPGTGKNLRYHDNHSPPHRTSDARRVMITAAEIPSYRCVTVSIGETTLYFRRYIDQWFRAHYEDDHGWYETAVSPEHPETVYGYYRPRLIT
jgi:hypothetical protein